MEKLNTKNIKFSLLIPCYGKAEHIYQMLKSIIKNGYFNYEIIICEQGPTDIGFLKD